MRADDLAALGVDGDRLDSFGTVGLNRDARLPAPHVGAGVEGLATGLLLGGGGGLDQRDLGALQGRGLSWSSSWPAA